MQQGDGHDLGCSPETFYFWQNGGEACSADDPPELCTFPQLPIRQVIDLETHTIVRE